MGKGAEGKGRDGRHEKRENHTCGLSLSPLCSLSSPARAGDHIVSLTRASFGCVLVVMPNVWARKLCGALAGGPSLVARPHVLSIHDIAIWAWPFAVRCWLLAFRGMRVVICFRLSSWEAGVKAYLYLSLLCRLDHAALLYHVIGWNSFFLCCIRCSGWGQHAWLTAHSWLRGPCALFRSPAPSQGRLLLCVFSSGSPNSL